MDLVTHSGAVPYLYARGQLHYVLITNRSGRWAFPKGLIEPGLQAWDSAAKEAWEEAGVTGQIAHSPTTTYHHHAWNRTHAVAMYLMAVDDLLEAWHEDHLRSRTVLPYASARDLIRPEATAVLDWAQQQLAPDRKPV
jgi:8-oxo-dGTP pyrophosphatase MutT (NUDIX family)